MKKKLRFILAASVVLAILMVISGRTHIENSQPHNLWNVESIDTITIFPPDFSAKL